MIKICENPKCSKEFEAREKIQRFCSRSCSATVNNSRHKKRSLKPAYCKYCEIEIPRKGHNHQPSVCQDCKDSRAKKKREVRENTILLEKECSYCNKVKKASEFYAITKGKGGLYSYCKDCAKKQFRDRTRKVKQQSVDYLGGKCEICGYNKCLRALDFHHKDPSQKDFNITAARITVFNDKLKNELDKCMLLCANCHREVHDAENE